MENSPIVTPNRRLKRRSSSMMNLSDAKNLVDKDMVTSKLNLIRDKNLARRNFRQDTLVGRRNIDIVSIFEETPAPVRIKEPINPIKQESCDFDLDKIQIKCEFEDNFEEQKQKQPDPTSKISNIKNKFSLFKNNVRNMISNNCNKKPVGLPPKSEPTVCNKIPTPLDENINNKINGQLKKLGQQRFNSTSNVVRSRQAVAPLNVLSTNTTTINSNNDFKRSLRNYDSCTSLRGSERNNKPNFKLGTKIQYNDSHLFAATQQPVSKKEVEKFNKMILKRKIASNYGSLHGSLCSLNSLN